MTSNNYLLPPNATETELSVDQAQHNLLTNIHTELIRWVKNPDMCPAALLPWLAWEFQVDTWNVDWTEQKKRDAIRRAHYIHSHRGTAGAVRRALTDSPFGTEIIEWFRQSPPGKPYTFRMNVEQKDLPVSELDHQDLKMAVLRAKNLRSWFSVHVYGRSTGTVYAAGYACATEYIRSRIFPTSITLTETEVWLEPGECRFIGVTILPPEAEDKSFTVRVAEPGCVTATLAEGGFLLTGQTYGECQVTVTTLNGISCTV
ncbi:phage tail protein I, partial [Escherichia coli]|nr:phage tail protein I [Escherichia coli]